MGFGDKCVQISALPLISYVILAKSVNLSQAQDCNVWYVKAPNRVSTVFPSLL